MFYQGYFFIKPFTVPIRNNRKPVSRLFHFENNLIGYSIFPGFIPVPVKQLSGRKHRL